MNAALDRRKLVAVLGLLGSDHPGEIVAAARQAERLRRAAGVTWGDIVSIALPLPEPQPTHRGAFDMANFCLDFRDTLLTPWEVDFCRDVGIRAANSWRLSEKQLAVLTRIHAKCRRVRWGADA